MAINRYGQPQVASPAIQKLAQKRAMPGDQMAPKGQGQLQPMQAPPAGSPVPGTPTMRATSAPAPAPQVQPSGQLAANRGQVQPQVQVQPPQSAREKAMARLRENQAAAQGQVADNKAAAKADGSYVYGSDSAGVSERQTDQRAAEVAELQATKAKAIQEARARMNLSGGGLSGQAGALEGDVSRLQDRTRVQTLTDLDQANASELAAMKEAEYQQGRRTIDDKATDQRNAYELGQNEEDLGEDVDGDGRIGFGAGALTIADWEAQERAGREVAGLNAGSGTASDPFQLTDQDLAKLKDPLNLEQISNTAGGQARFVDEDGRVYVVTGGGGGAGNQGNAAKPKTYDPDTGAYV